MEACNWDGKWKSLLESRHPLACSVGARLWQSFKMLLVKSAACLGVHDGALCTNLSIRDYDDLLKKRRNKWWKDDKGPKYSNSNLEERRALNELEKNSEITICPADKEGAIVVLDTEYYHLRMLEHLNSPTYRRLERNPMNKFKSEIDNLLKVALESNWITKKEHAYLTNQHPVTPIIYSLPKIHKHLTEPPLRPVVSGRGSVTEPLSKYVDFFLKDFVKDLPAYLGDTKDTLNWLSECTLNQKTILVLLDVKKLYGCIPLKDALDSAA